MRIRTCLHAGLAATGIAVASVAATTTAAATLPPSDTDQSTPLPPGALVTSFVNNQFTYCSIICPLLVDTGATALTTMRQAPEVYLTASRTNDTTTSIGIAAASVTGPTDAAAERAILADGTLVAPRALNAFEVGVVGLLDVGTAAANGLPTAGPVETARQDTYAALHAPIVPDPPPLATPHGVEQVTVIEAINVGAAVAFPAFNHVLSGAFQVPDAAARALATTGDPDRAAAAAADTATGVQTAATTVVTDAITDAIGRIRAAEG
ncbi:hypothetical protein ACFYTQ_06185 [Nocardia sp. NPDC004068]|uniref:hypothetical protein n=1 Tax=Nocardia sp. NPDC004068 TaxID=3364303 RepID=UPI0036BE06E1